MGDDVDDLACPVCSAPSDETTPIRYDGYAYGLKCHDCGQVRRIYPGFDDYGLEGAGDRGPTFIEEKMRVSYDIHAVYYEMLDALTEPLRRRGGDNG